MIMFYLVLTFYTQTNTGNPAFTAVTLPGTYQTQEDCDLAGKQAHDHYNGGAKLEWTCVPN